MNPQNRAVILARVSSKSQEDEGYSLDSQLKLLKGYCDRNLLQVVKVFRIAETASKDQSRKIFHEMLEYLYKDNIYHLAVEKTDRFTRNFKDAVAIDDWLEMDENRNLHAVKENLLLHKHAKSDVKFMWNIHLSVAKKYTDNLREEAMKGWAEKLAQGWLPAPPPPGYMTVTEGGKRIHIPNPETQPLVRLVFKKYLQAGVGTVLLTEYMKEVGIRTRNGKPLSKSNVVSMITNPFYIGINRFNGKDYKGAQTPIIDKALFEAVQNKLHKGRPAYTFKHNPVYKGMITCEDCRSKVTWQLQKGHYYGVCKRLTAQCKIGKMLREDVLEEQVALLLESLVSPSQEIIEWVIAESRKKHGEQVANTEKIIASVQLQIDRISRMEESLYDDKLAGEISAEKYKIKLDQLHAQKANLQVQMNRNHGNNHLILERGIALLELSQKAAKLYGLKSPNQKRVILSKLFSELTIKGGILSVTYTDFAKLISKNVLKTKEIMEASK